MGLFSNNKKLCPLCGAPTPRLLPTKVEDMPLCKECAAKIDLPGGTLDTMRVADLETYMACYEENKPLRDAFTETMRRSFGFLSGSLVLDTDPARRRVRIRRGVGKGVFAGFVYSVLQLILDIGQIMTWGLTPGVLVACFFMDYFIPFTVIGLAGLFRRHGYAGWLGGTALVIMMRYASHYLSGVFLWKSVGEILGRNIDNTYLYSLLYNGAFMVPELILTMIAAAVLFALPQTKKVLFEMGLDKKVA